MSEGLTHTSAAEKIRAALGKRMTKILTLFAALSRVTCSVTFKILFFSICYNTSKMLSELEELDDLRAWPRHFQVSVVFLSAFVFYCIYYFVCKTWISLLHVFVFFLKRLNWEASQRAGSLKIARRPENRQLNRYRDVLPCEYVHSSFVNTAARYFAQLRTCPRQV